ncbi:MAG TPA: hypothetical protein VFT06_06155 [Flavisolibacter sp.]|nr:hypothetical protein [Flavisolibacter sp.]
MENEQLLLEPLLVENNSRRRTLLPLWIKLFCWLFMVAGGCVVAGLIAALLSFKIQLSLYGLESSELLSPVGLFIAFLFLLKGVAAFGLWMEKDWAIHLAMADAIIGIAVCTVVVLVLPWLDPQPKFVFRLELVLLVPYLRKLLQLKNAWKLTSADNYLHA